VTVIGLLGLALGRGGVLPIINMATIALAGSYALSCWATLQLRRLRPNLLRPFRVAGGEITLRLAIAISILMALVSLIEPVTRLRGWGMPLEWMLLTVWALAGIGLWLAARKRFDHRNVNRSETT
jgi:amino acid transporter